MMVERCDMVVYCIVAMGTELHAVGQGGAGYSSEAAEYKVLKVMVTAEFGSERGRGGGEERRS
jgi:hypothetical protein